MEMEDTLHFTDEEVRSCLNGHGLKATPQRMRVYEAMCALGHASADTVYHRLGGARGTMTLATVYNVLESMTEAGLLVQRPSFSNKMYFDINTDDHCHLYRKDSHEIMDFPDEILRRLVEAHVRAQLPEGLSLDRVEIQVLCHAKEEGQA